MNNNGSRLADVQPDLMSFEAAREQARRAAAPLEAETVRLAEAIGRVLARPAFPHEDLVPFARSAMDGFAVRAQDVQSLLRLPIVGAVVAGDEAAHLRPGTAKRIATGAMLPQGADAVLPWEDVLEANGCIEATTHIFRGARLWGGR